MLDICKTELATANGPRKRSWSYDGPSTRIVLNEDFGEDVEFDVGELLYVLQELQRVNGGVLPVRVDFKEWKGYYGEPK